MKFVSVFKGAAERARLLFQGRLSCYDIALSLVKDKAGLEIGGPSSVFRDWYAPLVSTRRLRLLTIAIFRRERCGLPIPDSYKFSSGKAAGKTIICDGSDLSVLPDDSYDFILSSHNLEHIANPVKALRDGNESLGLAGG